MKKKTNNYDELVEFLTNCSLGFPKEAAEKFCKSLETKGMKVNFERDGDYSCLTIEQETPEEGEFDDTSTIELVKHYKESIKKLDDDLFVDIVEELEQQLDLQKFNDLLDLKQYSEEQANEVEEMIELSTDIICLHLQHKIQDLVELYELF